MTTAVGETMRREQTDLVLGVVENAPTILFLGLLKSGMGLDVAGWTACVAAAAVFALFHALGRRADTIVLGINVNFLVMAPAVVGAFAVGQEEIARWLVALGETGAVASVFLVGAVLTLASPRGFVGAEGIGRAATRRNSIALLVLAGGALAWSAAHTGQEWLSIVLPLIVLFTARRFMLARIADRGAKGTDGSAMGVVLAPAE